MSWSFSQALVEQLRRSGLLDSEQSARLKSIRSAGKSSFDGKKKAAWNPFPSSTTLDASTADLGVERWISSLQASRANRSQSPEGGAAKTTAGTCGRTLSASFAKWDRDSRCLKTSQACLALTGISDRYSGSFPKRGMTRNGVAYPLPPWALRTSESGSGYWPTPVAHDDGKTPEAHLAMKQRMPGGPRSQITSLNVMVKAVERGLWPTPRAEGFDAGGTDARRSLHASVKRFPTPTSSMATMGDLEQARFAGNGGTRPTYAEAKRWPTPNATDWKGASQPEGRRPECDDDLPSAVKRWPTPQARDGESRGPQAKRYENPDRSNDLPDAVEASGTCGSLNPAWVELLMGWVPGWSGLESIGSGAVARPWDENWEAGVRRVADKVPHRSHRLKALGNGIVPQCMARAWTLLIS